MKELSNIITNIKPSGIRKFFDVVMEMGDAISLGVGEPDFDTPWRIRDEGIFTLERGKTFYTSNAGLMELRQEISKYIKNLIGIEYSATDEIVVTVGGSEGIDIAMRSLINAGDEVIIPQPSFVCYEPICRLAGGIPKIINLEEKDDFKLTVEEFKKSITEKTKAVILSYPNNPTGTVMSKAELEPIARLCIENDIYVISDEIYSELTYSGKHFSIAQIEGMRERTIIINGFSKSFAMTGWRLGYTLAPRFITEQMTKIHQYAIMCAPTNSQYAATIGLRECLDSVYDMKEEYKRRRNYLVNRFKEMNLDCFEPFGAFYIFPSIKKYNMTSEEFATKLLLSKKVAVVPGSAFGEAGEGYIRISYAYSIEELKEALDRLEAFLQEIEQ